MKSAEFGKIPCFLSETLAIYNGGNISPAEIVSRFQLGTSNSDFAPS